MGNENLIQNTELQNEQLKDETETFNWIVLRRLRSLTYHISL